MVLNLLNQWWANLSKLFLKGSVIHNFYHMLCVMGTAQFHWIQLEHIMVFDQEPMSSICQLGAQESRPLKSKSSNNLPYLCLMVSLGVWGSWDSSSPPAIALPEGVWAQVMQLAPWPPGFSSGGSAVCSVVPYHHDCFLIALPQLSVCVLHSGALWQRTIFSL